MRACVSLYVCVRLRPCVRKCPVCPVLRAQVCYLRYIFVRSFLPASSCSPWLCVSSCQFVCQCQIAGKRIFWTLCGYWGGGVKTSPPSAPGEKRWARFTPPVAWRCFQVFGLPSLPSPPFIIPIAVRRPVPQPEPTPRSGPQGRARPGTRGMDFYGSGRMAFCINLCHVYFVLWFISSIFIYFITPNRFIGPSGKTGVKLVPVLLCYSFFSLYFFTVKLGEIHVGCVFSPGVGYGMARPPLWATIPPGSLGPVRVTIQRGIPLHRQGPPPSHSFKPQISRAWAIGGIPSED